jgi:hypothetical protein
MNQSRAKSASKLIGPEPSSPSPQIRALHDYWKKKRGNRAMPARTDLDPIEFRHYLPNIFLADIVENGDDLRCRLVGGAAGEYLGGVAQGCRASELACRPFAELFIDNCRRMAAKCAPILVLLQFRFLIEPAVQVELLLMPLSSDGKLAEIVFGMLEIIPESWTADPTLAHLYVKAASIGKTIIEL